MHWLTLDYSCIHLEQSCDLVIQKLTLYFRFHLWLVKIINAHFCSFVVSQQNRNIGQVGMYSLFLLNRCLKVVIYLHSSDSFFSIWNDSSPVITCRVAYHQHIRNTELSGATSQQQVSLTGWWVKDGLDTWQSRRFPFREYLRDVRLNNSLVVNVTDYWNFPRIYILMFDVTLSKKTSPLKCELTTARTHFSPLFTSQQLETRQPSWNTTQRLFMFGQLSPTDSGTSRMTVKKLNTKTSTLLFYDKQQR